VKRSTLSYVVGAIGATVVPLATVAAQQSDVALSPFLSFLPSAGGNPLAGLALTLAGDGNLGLRGSAHIGLDNYRNSTTTFGSSTGTRPWGADADLVMSIGGRAFGSSNRSLSPFVFAGIGTATADSGAFRVTHSNWSYGVGLAVPLGGAIDLFGESRWRMSRYVLPTATLAPKPTQEIRAGFSLHFGGLGGSSSHGHGSRHADAAPFLRLPTATAVVPPSATAKRVVGTADAYVGAPYRYGGTSPTSGFDCSGFVQFVFSQHGVELPRTAREQAQVGQGVPADWRAISAGDLVMFQENGKINHVAIYAGHNRIIHSSASGGGVRYDDLSTPRGEWFMDHMVVARRVTPDAHGLLLDLGRSFPDINVELDGPDHAPAVKR